jgi:hypothetical protein
LVAVSDQPASAAVRSSVEVRRALILSSSSRLVLGVPVIAILLAIMYLDGKIHGKK